MICNTFKCENDVGKNGYCKNCNAGFYYWSKKRPIQILERRRKLTIYASRVKYVMSNRGIKDEK